MLGWIDLGREDECSEHLLWAKLYWGPNTGNTTVPRGAGVTVLVQTRPAEGCRSFSRPYGPAVWLQCLIIAHPRTWGEVGYQLTNSHAQLCHFSYWIKQDLHLAQLTLFQPGGLAAEACQNSTHWYLLTVRWRGTEYLISCLCGEQHAKHPDGRALKQFLTISHEHPLRKGCSQCGFHRSLTVLLLVDSCFCSWQAGVQHLSPSWKSGHMMEWPAQATSHPISPVLLQRCHSVLYLKSEKSLFPQHTWGHQEYTRQTGITLKEAAKKILIN